MVHCLRGIGMYTMMACMLMYFLLILTLYGGTGVSHGAFPVLVSDGVSDILGIIILGIADSLHIGMVVIMPVIGVVTGEATGVVIGAPDGMAHITDIGLPETGGIRMCVRDAIRLPMVFLPVLPQALLEVRIIEDPMNGSPRIVEILQYVVLVLAA